MSTQPQSTILGPMSADAFLAWEDDQPDERRFELVGGEIVAMSPERAGHRRAKFRATSALDAAIRARGLDCEALIDSLNVRVADDAVYKPDVIVCCGPPLSDDATIVADPVIVVEVLSPSTRQVDTGAKLKGYLSLPSVRHYLILNPKDRSIIHHRRAGHGDLGEPIETRILNARAGTTEGDPGADLILEPPGLVVPCRALFEAT